MGAPRLDEFAAKSALRCSHAVFRTDGKRSGFSPAAGQFKLVVQSDVLGVHAVRLA